MRDVREGRITVGQAMEEVRGLPFEDLGFAKVDTHRGLRRGFPEVVYCPGKTDAQIASILERMAADSSVALATRATPETYRAVARTLKENTVAYHDAARMIVVGNLPRKRTGRVLVVTAGTSDLPVAEEAAVTAELMGNIVERAYDIGVAGLHRLLDQLPSLRQARVVIAVAGMEGALPSVIGGLVAVPVVAVPTSTGYGASFQGLAALLAMLNSCAPGVAVVNIDNGFGAGYLAGLINLGKRATYP